MRVGINRRLMFALLVAMTLSSGCYDHQRSGESFYTESVSEEERRDKKPIIGKFRTLSSYTPKPPQTLRGSIAQKSTLIRKLRSFTRMEFIWLPEDGYSRKRMRNSIC